MKVLFYAAAVWGASQLAGCASVLDGYQQVVAVETFGQEGRVFGAHCELKNPKGTASVVTPGIVFVRRSFDDLSVRCEKAGLPVGQVTVSSVTKPMAILGGISGMAVDAGTGAAFEYPPHIKVTLGQVQVQGQAALAPVDNRETRTAQPPAGVMATRAAQ